MRRALVGLWLCLLGNGCGSLQKPPSFVTKSKLDDAVNAVGEALVADGHKAKKIGHQSNVVQTDWKNTSVLVEDLKGKAATAFTRFTVTVAPVAQGVEITTRMDCRRCQLGSAQTTRGRIRGVCEDMTVMPSEFQEELEAVSRKLEQALKSPGHDEGGDSSASDDGSAGGSSGENDQAEQSSDNQGGNED